MVVMLLAGDPLSAATFTWIKNASGNASGSWASQANWSGAMLPTTTERNKQDVLYCPTDQWHRAVESLADKIHLIGYQLLPGRDANGWPNYNDQGLGEWVYRKKLGGPYRKAPVMIDKIQATGAMPNLAWFGSTGVTPQSFPFANHRNSAGISIGKN